jgi:hypothetical protein
MIWLWFKDDWLITREAARLFAISTLLVLALTPVFLGEVHTNALSSWERLPWTILGILGPIALFFVWFGMWRYWTKIDRTSGSVKWMWFVILLIGFWWGGSIYCVFVYLPQVYGKGTIVFPSRRP